MRVRTCCTTRAERMSGGGGVRFTPVPPWNFSSTESTTPSGVAGAVNSETGAGRIAAGAVAPTACRLPQAEAILEQLAAAAAVPTQPPLDELEHAARADIAPIDDHRSTAAYRAHATATLVRRLAQRLLGAQ